MRLVPELTPSTDGWFTWQTAVLGLLVVGPLVVLAVAGALPHSAALRPTWLDAVMAIPLYVVAGFESAFSVAVRIRRAGFYQRLVMGARGPALRPSGQTRPSLRRTSARLGTSPVPTRFSLARRREPWARVGTARLDRLRYRHARTKFPTG